MGSWPFPPVPPHPTPDVASNMTLSPPTPLPRKNSAELSPSPHPASPGGDNKAPAPSTRSAPVARARLGSGGGAPFLDSDNYYDDDDDDDDESAVDVAEGEMAVRPTGSGEATAMQFDLCGSMWKRRGGLGRNREKNW